MTSHASSPPNGDGAHIPDSQTDAATAKRALRRTLLAARRGLDDAALASAEVKVLQHLRTLPELDRAGTVAAYVSMGTEPRTDLLVAHLLEQRHRVLLPVLLPDNDLDWAEYRGPTDLVPARFGLREPSGPRLGTDAISTVDLIVVPGVAAGPRHHRLGRGGGSYDRALARLAPDTVTVLLLHEGETDQPVPVEAHDAAVDVVVTPAGVLRRA